jgi:hypothetical protein
MLQESGEVVGVVVPAVGWRHRLPRGGTPPERPHGRKDVHPDQHRRVAFCPPRGAYPVRRASGAVTISPMEEKERGDR